MKWNMKWKRIICTSVLFGVSRAFHIKRPMCKNVQFNVALWRSGIKKSRLMLEYLLIMVIFNIKTGCVMKPSSNVDKPSLKEIPAESLFLY